MAIPAAAAAKAAAQVLLSKDKKKATARLLIVSIAGAALPSLFAVATVKEIEKKIVQKIEQKVINKLFDKFQEKIDQFKERMKANNDEINAAEKAKLDQQSWKDTSDSGQTEAENANTEAESSNLDDLSATKGIPPDEVSVADSELVDAADAANGRAPTDPTTEDPSEIKFDSQDADKAPNNNADGDLANRSPEQDTDPGNHDSELPDPANGSEASAIKSLCSSTCNADPAQDPYIGDLNVEAEMLATDGCCTIDLSDPAAFGDGTSDPGGEIVDSITGSTIGDAIPLTDVPSETPPDITVDPAPIELPASAVRHLSDGAVLSFNVQGRRAAVSLTTRDGYRFSMLSPTTPAAVARTATLLDTSSSSTTSGTILPCDDQCNTLMAMEEAAMLVTSDFDQTKHGPLNQEGLGQMLPHRRAAQMGCFQHAGTETSGGPDVSNSAASYDISTLGCELIDDIAATRVPGQPPDMRAAFAKYVKDNHLPPINGSWPGESLPDRLCTPKLDPNAALQAAGTTTTTTTTSTKSSTSTDTLPAQPVCTDPTKDCMGIQADQKCPSVLQDFIQPISGSEAQSSTTTGLVALPGAGGGDTHTVNMPTATLMTEAYHTFYQWNTDPSTVYHTNPLDDGSDIGLVATVSRPDAPNIAAQTIAAAAYNAGFRETELIEAVALAGAATGYKKDFEGTRSDGKTGYGAWAISAEDAAKAHMKPTDLKDPVKAATALYTLREPNNGWGFVCAAANDGACNTKDPNAAGPAPFLAFEDGPDPIRSATQALSDIVVAPPCTGDGSQSSSSGSGTGATGGGIDLAAQVAAKAGWRGQALVVFVAVAGSESGYDPSNHNYCCWGLWQINILPSGSPQYSAQQMVDPQQNANAAFKIYQSSGLNMNSWQSYGNGAYQQFMGQAQAAVAKLGSLPSGPGCTISVIQASGPVPCDNGTSGGPAGGGGSTTQSGTCAQSSTGGYVNPIKPQWYLPARIDQGDDWLPQLQDTPVIAIGDATIKFAQAGGTGWPGTPGGCVVYELSGGSLAGKDIYVCENVSPTVKAGDHVTAGQTIAFSHPGYAWTEWGWAAGPYQSPLTPYGPHPDGYCTDGGLAFTRFTHSLGAPWNTMDVCPYSTVPPGPNYP